MAYLAHIGFKMNSQFNYYDWNQWETIDQKGSIILRKRLKDGDILEYVAGMFDDKWDALKYGKQLYVSIFLQLLRKDIHIDDAGCETYYRRMSHPMDHDAEDELPECLFIWRRNHRGGGIGLDVYEAESLDQVDERVSDMEISIQAVTDEDLLKIDEKSKPVFDYTERTQSFIRTLFFADNAPDVGLQMTLFTGILEKIVEEIEKENPLKRTKEEINVMDQLIRTVLAMDIDETIKNGIAQYLERYEHMSITNKLVWLCSKYGKPKYGKHPSETIIKKAYKIRSSFSHVGNKKLDYSSPAFYIKWLVIDVVCNYLSEKQPE